MLLHLPAEVALIKPIGPAGIEHEQTSVEVQVDPAANQLIYMPVPKRITNYNESVRFSEYLFETTK